MGSCVPGRDLVGAMQREVGDDVASECDPET